MSPRIITKQEFQQREIELIEVALSLIEECCLTTLTIDKLVAASSYSKGTIYKHFLCKEDLLLAICNTCLKELKQLFSRALQFKGNRRERIVAVQVSYIIWAKLRPSQLFVVLSAHSPSVSACSSEQQNHSHEQCEAELMSIMNQEIINAIEDGDLQLPDGMKLEQVTFSLWSAAWGAMALIMSKGNSIQLQPMILERESFTNGHLILDGLNWKPFYKDWDYKQSVKRITQEIFQSEIEILEKKNTPFIFV